MTSIVHRKLAHIYALFRRIPFVLFIHVRTIRIISSGNCGSLGKKYEKPGHLPGPWSSLRADSYIRCLGGMGMGFNRTRLQRRPVNFPPHTLSLSGLLLAWPYFFLNRSSIWHLL